MAQWSKALPLIARCLSPLSGSDSDPGRKACEKVDSDYSLSLAAVWIWIPAESSEKGASDLGLGGGFRHVLRFPTPLATV